MRRFFSLLAVLSLQNSLVACSYAEKKPEGYDLKVAAYFRSNDGGWASKWKELDGGLNNIQRSLGRGQGSYLLVHVTGVDPQQREISTLCPVFISTQPKAGPCVLEKAHQVFAPIKIVAVETENNLSKGKATLKAIVGVQPTSWLNIEPRTIGSIELELPS